MSASVASFGLLGALQKQLKLHQNTPPNRKFAIVRELLMQLLNSSEPSTVRSERAIEHLVHHVCALGPDAVPEALYAFIAAQPSQLPEPLGQQLRVHAAALCREPGQRARGWAGTRLGSLAAADAVVHTLQGLIRGLGVEEDTMSQEQARLCLCGLHEQLGLPQGLLPLHVPGGDGSGVSRDVLLGVICSQGVLSRDVGLALRGMVMQAKPKPSALRPAFVAAAGVMQAMT